MLRAILLCFAYMRSSNERCDKLSAAYLAYERDQPCPSSQDRPGFRFESVSFTFRKPLNRTALGEPPTSVDALLGGPGETVFKFK